MDEEPQTFLNELFTARHELLTIKTMTSQGGQIYQRAIESARFVGHDGVKKMKDLVDQYERVAEHQPESARVPDGRHQFYRARTDTKMTIAAERLAVIAAITLPITFAVVRGRHERDRQRGDALGMAERLAVDHVDHVPDLVALGETAGLVVMEAR